jgi:hypothetical protein
MAEYTVESKSQLAKLLATENITIRHEKVPTAVFDIKNRILICPIWKVMSGELYDLFMGHEVGHALETPIDGWHDSVSIKGKKYKHFLNVVEDARIEKKIKRRYPGLKRSFFLGYKKLLEDDFFGINNLDVSKLALIDKINLHFKCGSSVPQDFSEEELSYVEMVESCETWDDVVFVTDKLFGYCKEEQQKKKQQAEKNSSNVVDSGNQDQSMEDYSDSMDDDGEEEDIGSADAEDEGEDNTHSNESVVNSDTEETEEPTSITDEHFREKESTLLDAECLPYVYVNIPSPILNEIITPQKRVHELLDLEFSSVDKHQKLQEFKRKNANYISLLVKEFEMRKAAKSFAKRKVSSTGDIDVNKIYKYRLDDNIFRKIMKVHKGKSHGLVLLLDRSSSMTNSIDGAFEQIMVLSMFCKRVNIPFVVYGFGNQKHSRSMDFGPKENPIFFDEKEDNVVLKRVYLREYLNSDMKNSEFNNALANVAELKSRYNRRYNFANHVPLSELLSATPLIESIVAIKPIVEEFKKRHNLEIVNFVIVQDGDSDKIVGHKKGFHYKPFASHKNNYILCDKKSNFQVQLDYTKHEGDAFTVAILDWFTKVTGTKVFAFFIVENRKYYINIALTNRYYIDGEKIFGKNMKSDSYNKITEMVDKFRNDELLISSNPGYEKFFLILGGKNLITDDDFLDIGGDVSIRRLKTAFSKKYDKRKTNRVLVNQFIKGIAE